MGTSSGLDLAVLGQYGAIGLFALLLAIFARNAYNREVMRSDRLEEKLLHAHEIIQEKVIPALQDSTRTVQDTTALVRDVTREMELTRVRQEIVDQKRGGP